MHPKPCIVLVLLFSFVVIVSLAQQQQLSEKVNVVLEKSCWTSESCRREFKCASS